MRGVPKWAWIVACGGLVATVAGAWAEGYVQAVLLQVGTVAMFVVPVFLAERGISETIERQYDDLAAIKKAEGAVDLDDVWRDFGQKLGARTRPAPLTTLESELAAGGWSLGRSRSGYRIWVKDGQHIALPDNGEPVPAPIVRTTIRATGWRLEDWSDPHT
jgi:hypothetical protein